jgi:hypothetical protein
MTPAQARRAIYGYKMDDILQILTAQKHWNKTQAREADEWYRNFLWLTYLQGNRPVYAIYKYSDDLWHAHIIYTERYKAFCERVFGRFIDHTPLSGRVTQPWVKRFERSLRSYEAEFGNSPLSVPLSNFISPCY